MSKEGFRTIASRHVGMLSCTSLSPVHLDNNVTMSQYSRLVLNYNSS